MGTAAAADRRLSDVLAARRQRLFVGRSSELELMRAALDSDELPFSVLHLHGPGGIGKSSLLDAFSDIASNAGATVVRIDGRVLSPTSSSVLDALRTALDVPAGDGPITGRNGRVVLLFDTYERIAVLDDWLRNRLLPRLPATALTVIAARTPPDPAWRADPGWGDLLRVVALRNLAPTESRKYLHAAKVDASLHERILQVTHGHPLGLALVTDLASRGGDVNLDPLPPDLVGTLLRRFVEVVPSQLHRRALEVCALARVTTEALLRDALDVEDAHELFTWLRGLSFVYTSRQGLFPHDLARDALDTDFWWRDLDGYRSVFHRVWDHVFAHLRSTTGREQMRAIFDLKFVYRNYSGGVMSPADWASWGEFYPERAAPADREAILEIVLNAEGPESAAIAEHWLDSQPEGFFVLRKHDNGIRGFIARINLTGASAQDIATDPGAQSAWDFAHRGPHPRPGEVVTQARFIIDREAYQDPSPTLNAAPVLGIQQYLGTPNLCWDFTTLADPDRWNEYYAVADLPRAQDADFEVGGRTFGLFAHDFRRMPVEAVLKSAAEQALTRDTASEETTEALVLSQPEFEQAVKQALQNLGRPDLLSRNPLLQTRLLRDRANGGTPDAATLDGLLRDAIDALGEHPRDDKMLSAVDRTYLRPAGTQESAAAMLGLPFSTYRRHLTQGVARIVGWLWEREIYGQQ